ncbi:MAG: NAD(P)-dependent oxidoreductase [Ignavibacteria bacterium]|nr:NAD(P)-dependent oxidoreductase [Ignavibacteria bacterium]
MKIMITGGTGFIGNYVFIDDVNSGCIQAIEKTVNWIDWNNGSKTK